MASKRFAPKLKIKKGDRVKVIAGDYKGTEGEVLQVFPKAHRVMVEEVNIAKKHQKPTQTSQGGIVDIAMPIHISNVQLIDPKSGELTRVGRRMEDGKNVRYCKASGETIK